MIVKIKKLSPNAVIPKYATEGSCGLDITATEVFHEKYFMVCKTGLAIQLPKGTAGFLMPRSSISNTSLSLANAVGLLDVDFTGELSFRFRDLGTDQPVYEVGDKIGQLVIVPIIEAHIQEVKELDETSRGAGGYGSSGR